MRHATIFPGTNLFISSLYHNTIATTLPTLQYPRGNGLQWLFLFLEWRNEIDDIFENQDFEALIITDINQKILWVNNGFTEMTGYSKKFAINKTPNFLQGENTQRTTKKRIRTKLGLLEPFTEVITNYRKDNTPYKCEVKIIPLYKEKVTHFLAIEKKVV